MNARALYEALIAHIRNHLPPGISRAYLDSWVSRTRDMMIAAIAGVLAEAQADDVLAEGVPPELWTAAKRRDANLAAMRILASKAPDQITAEDLRVLLAYSGWGGLSIADAASKFPPGIPAPDPIGLIHEYYTPSKVANAVAKLVQEQLPTLNAEGAVLALEPAAGIGRFIHAMSGAGFKGLRWLACELSPLSAAILRHTRPMVALFEGTFERWIAEQGPQYAGKVNLLVSNPPYGPRGGSITDDPDPEYREKWAYAYFLRRGLSLLAPDGLGIFLIPSGFLSGRTPRHYALREKVLRENHLAAAFRLPSRLFPGAMLVTDLIVFRSRGGFLSTPNPDDDAIMQGDYFRDNPGQIMGREVGKDAGDEDQTSSPRWGYQVEGEFSGELLFNERPRCTACVVRAPKRMEVQAPRGVARVLQEATQGLAWDAQVAAVLGVRVDKYLSSVARSDPKAAEGYSELRAALLDWRERYGNPHRHLGIKELRARGHVAIERFLTAWTPMGELVTGLQVAPKIERIWQGASNDVLAQAEHVYRQHRHLTVRTLADFHAEVGGKQTPEALRRVLLAEDAWIEDGEALVPAGDYMVGHLWPRYDRAKTLATKGDVRAGRLAAALLKAIEPSVFEDITDVSPRQGWVPMELVKEWATANLNEGRQVNLVRSGGLVLVEGVEYNAIDGEAWIRNRMRWFIGWLNHDRTVFQPSRGETVVGAGEGKPKDKITADDKRIALAKAWEYSFRGWIAASPERQALVTQAYNRRFRGFIAPPENVEPLVLARWNPDGPRPRPVQISGARRVIHNRGGLVAFDVGVGKTYTALLVLAAARQQGWSKRPVIVVPNSIVWKWYADIQRTLPDYRIGVIGSKRSLRDPKLARVRARLARPDAVAAWSTAHKRAKKAAEVLTMLSESAWTTLGDIDHGLSYDAWEQMGREGFITLEVPPPRMIAETDSAEERGEKWTRFQAGEYDVVLVTYTALPRTRMNESAVNSYVAKHEAVQREIALQVRNAQDARGELTERQQALLSQGAAAWVAQQMELPKGWAYDTGVAWDDLGVDLLILDEAQNFKNLYLPEPREGGVPRFMGNAGEGAKRAWQFDFRAASVRKKTGGAGVVLLSATPAKNSPLEFYSLLQYVDPAAFLRMGINNSEEFIDRYLKIELKPVIGTDLAVKEAAAVTGFKNLDELRDLVFRLGNFKTAEEAGIKLPTPEVRLVQVDMNAEQSEKYDDYIGQIEELMAEAEGGGGGQSAKTMILGLMARMAMVAIHPALDEGHTWKSAPRASVAGGFQVSSPKFAACAEAVLANRTCGHIIFVDNVAAHLWMRATLTEAGIPEGRIAVMNADNADVAERFRIAQAFNGLPEEDIDPEYDVVIANQVAYEGIDLQTRTCAIHHLDLPWEPATLQQRNGRGVRQGNTLASILVAYYFARRSLDGLRFNLIQGKLGWMTDLLHSQKRDTNNPGAQSDMGPEEILYLISRDPEATRARLEAVKAKMEEEARLKEGQEAARLLKSAYDRFRRAEVLGRSDPQEAAVLRANAEERLADLVHVRAESWPWLALAGEVRERRCAINQFYPFDVVPDKSRWLLTDQVGNPLYVEALVDELGDIKIRQWDRVELKPVGKNASTNRDGFSVTPAQYEPGTWPANEGAGMVMWVNNAKWQTWAPFPTSWWDRWWPVVGEAILANAVGYHPQWRLSLVPYVLPDGSLGQLTVGGLNPSGIPRVIPPTSAGWAQLLDVALKTPRLRWTEANRIAQAWWGQEFPKGHLTS